MFRTRSTVLRRESRGRAVVDVQQVLREHQESKAAGKAVEGCLKALIRLLWAVVMLWWWPFVVMLALGIVHGRFPAVPALGFWETWACYCAYMVLVRRFAYAELVKAFRKQ